MRGIFVGAVLIALATADGASGPSEEQLAAAQAQAAALAEA